MVSRSRWLQFTIADRAQFAYPHTLRDQYGVDRLCPCGISVEEEHAVRDPNVHHQPANMLGLLQGLGSYQQTLASIPGHLPIPPSPLRFVGVCQASGMALL